MKSLQNCLFSIYIDWEDEYLKGPVPRRLSAVIASSKLKSMNIGAVLDCNSSLWISIYAFLLDSILEECKAVPENSIYQQQFGGSCQRIYILSDLLCNSVCVVLAALMNVLICHKRLLCLPSYCWNINIYIWNQTQTYSDVVLQMALLKRTFASPKRAVPTWRFF